MTSALQRKAVQIRRGRATVTGDNRFIMPLALTGREGEAGGRPGSQETLGLHAHGGPAGAAAPVLDCPACTRAVLQEDR